MPSVLGRTLEPALTDLLSSFELGVGPDGALLAPAVARNLPKTFGGLVLAQAVCAAGLAADSRRRLHSLHAYFVRAGDPELPLLLRAQTLRRGASFTTYEVTAEQSGRRVFVMLASLHAAESGLEYDVIPTRLDPASTGSPIDAWSPAPDVRLPEWWTTQGPVDVLFASRPVGLVGGPPGEAQLRLWLRPADRRPLSATQTQALVAYASDLSLLDVALQPFGRSWFAASPVAGASLDHALWFHRPFEWTDWISYDISSSVSTEGRALVRGEMRDPQGRLVATAVQEGLLRDT